MLLSVSAYQEISARISEWADELCDGKQVYVLEGGYHLQALAGGVAATISALLRTPYQDTMGESSLKETDIGDLPVRIARYHHLLG